MLMDYCPPPRHVIWFLGHLIINGWCMARIPDPRIPFYTYFFIVRLSQNFTPIYGWLEVPIKIAPFLKTVQGGES